MKNSVFLGLIFIAAVANASTDLREVMAPVCEDLGTTQGIECVKLQRQMEAENVVIDPNAAAVCSLIWQWGSKSQSTHEAADLVLSCFRKVANLNVSVETKDTCDGPIADIQGSIATINLIRIKVKRMMDCITQLGIPMRR